MPAIDLTGLRISSPCPADDDVLVQTDRGYSCSACQREVVDVSRHTQAEVRAIFAHAEATGQRVCVELLVRSGDGAVLYADGHLVARRAEPRQKRVLPMLAASLALAACTPREETKPDTTSDAASSALVAPSVALAPSAPSAPTVPSTAPSTVALATSASSEPIARDGGCAESQAEPASSNKAKAKANVPPHHQQLRGGPMLLEPHNGPKEL